jgi:phospholipase C
MKYTSGGVSGRTGQTLTLEVPVKGKPPVKPPAHPPGGAPGGAPVDPGKNAPSEHALRLCDPAGKPVKGAVKSPHQVAFDGDGWIPLSKLKGGDLEISLDAGQGKSAFWEIHEGRVPGKLKDHYGHVKEGATFTIPAPEPKKDLTIVVDFKPGIWLCDIEDTPGLAADISSAKALHKPLKGELRCWPTLDAAGERDVSAGEKPRKVIPFSKIGRASAGLIPPDTARIDIYLDPEDGKKYRKAKGSAADEVVDKGHYHVTSASGELLVAGQFEDYSLSDKARLTLRQVPKEDLKITVSSWDDPRTRTGSGVAPLWGKSFSKVKHFFVLMLENRSFDSMLGYSGIKEVDGHRRDNPFINYYANHKKAMSTDTMPGRVLVDPGHEFKHISAQLWGSPKHAGDSFNANDSGTPGMGGFAATYFYRLCDHEKDLDGEPNAGGKAGEITAKLRSAGKTPEQYARTIMLGYNPRTLPVLNALAREYAVCDRWFCSEPSWTTPNRFFMYAATAGNMDDTPKSSESIARETVTGFHFSNGTIFQLLDKQRVTWRLYENSPFNQARLVDGIPQLTPFNPYMFGAPNWTDLFTPLWSLTKSIDPGRVVNLLTDWGSVRSLGALEKDLQDPKQWSPNGSYNFIEPNYGFPTKTSGVVFDFVDGESQHPVGAVHRGEELIRKVYHWLRKSKIWEESALIITYDEHGGFFDHVPPPRAVPPGDAPLPPPAKNSVGFKYGRYGVRVPAIVISPWIPKGVVDHTVYDHASALRTVERRLEVPPLTARDKNANDLAHLFSLEAPRNCIQELPRPKIPESVRFDDLTEALGTQIAHRALLGTIGMLWTRDLTDSEKRLVEEAAVLAAKTEPAAEKKQQIVKVGYAAAQANNQKAYAFLKSVQGLLLLSQSIEEGS